jgi:epoxyqueuosine reductase QueG
MQPGDVDSSRSTAMPVEAIRRLAEAEHLAAIGFGSASSLAGEPVGQRPDDLLPGARSLICFAIPVPAGVYGAQSHTAEMVWRSQSLNYRRLDSLSIRFAALLEEGGERAAPVFGCAPMALNEKGDVAGYLNLIRMGEATGIGVIGKNGLLLRSGHGSRLMLGGVVTTAAIPEPLPRAADETGCPAECMACVEACPVKAISAADRRVNIMRCLRHTSRTPSMSRIRFVLLRALRPRSAARLMNLTAFDEHTFHVCSRCVALCPYGDPLER